jgi:hypothetical protein
MAASIRSPFTIGDWHSTHTGAAENVKLSRIHPLQPSAEQDHIEVNSSGASSTGFFREKYMREPSFSYSNSACVYLHNSMAACRRLDSYTIFISCLFYAAV